MNSTIKSIDTVLIFTPVSISTSWASLGLLKKSNCLLILVVRELLFCSACSSLLCSAKDYLAEEADLLFLLISAVSASIFSFCKRSLHRSSPKQQPSSHSCHYSTVFYPFSFSVISLCMVDKPPHQQVAKDLRDQDLHDHLRT